MHFLVIDDSPLDIRLISSLLEDMGHSVESCQSTEGALEKIAAGNYDAVFLDIVMPEEDGYKLLRSLRANPTTAKQPVVLYSSKKTALEVSYGIKRAGADEYLTKPATRENLTRVLEKVL